LILIIRLYAQDNLINDACTVVTVAKNASVDGSVMNVHTLAAQRWGDMRKDLEAKWEPMQREMLENQARIENVLLQLKWYFLNVVP